MSSSASQKVLFLNPSAQLGGAERSLLDVLASLRAARPDWALGLVVTAEGPLIERARALGVETSVLPLPAILASLGDGGAGPRARRTSLWSLARTIPAAVFYAVRLRRLIGRLSPTVLHSNGFKMHVLAAWSRPRRTPLVWHLHDFISRRPVMSVLMRYSVGRVARVVVNSKSVASDLVRVCGDRVPVVVVYNAVDLNAFSPEGEALDLDRLAGLPAPPEEAVRVGLVATLGWWKGHATFLRAISLLPPDLPLRGYVIGGALYETAGSQHSLETLRNVAEQLGVADRVGFTGFIEDVPAAMRALDVVVHASIEPEAFGLVIIEGMACARPVIASDSGGAAELIAGGENALPHTSGNAEELAACIERLVRDGDYRRWMGEHGRRIVERDFDRSRLAEELIPVYAAAAGSAAPGGVVRDRW